MGVRVGVDFGVLHTRLIDLLGLGVGVLLAALQDVERFGFGVKGLGMSPVYLLVACRE